MYSSKTNLRTLVTGVEKGRIMDISVVLKVPVNFKRRLDGLRTLNYVHFFVVNTSCIHPHPNNHSLDAIYRQ